MDWDGWYPGGVRWGAPNGANNNDMLQGFCATYIYCSNTRFVVIHGFCRDLHVWSIITQGFIKDSDKNITDIPDIIEEEAGH